MPLGSARQLSSSIRASAIECSRRRGSFVRQRLSSSCAAAGVSADRVVFDPGMGFFLGRDALPSLTVLRHLEGLAASHGALLVSVSRKSFLGEVTGSPVAQRGPATLAAELWAVRSGAAFVRTHDVKALRDALAVEAAIGAAGEQAG